MYFVQMIMTKVKTMTDKAYIVTNEQQEREVLEKLEREGVKWRFKSKPTEWVPTRDSYSNVQFPYVLFNDDGVTWGEMSELEDNYEIVYDGRKEENMSDKYVVSQEFMNELEEWKNKYFNDTNYFVSHLDIRNLPHIVSVWKCDGVYDNEANNRLIAIIRWVNGEDVFEIEKPKKWVVRSKDSSEADRHLYVRLDISYKVKDTTTLWGISNATKFDTKEEAQEWANSHQEVIGVK